MSTSAQRHPKFVYQAYGARRFRLQAELSIRSLLAQGVAADCVVVFTDHPEEFANLSGHTLDATASLLRQWSGACGFHHRVKIELIRCVRSAFDLPVVYVDSDTIWRGPPDGIYRHLADEHFVMHQCEALLSDSFYPEYRAALRMLEARGRLGLLSGDLNQVRMYNAGAIGLPRHSGDALQRVLGLCDDLSLLVPRRMELVEQLAFSYVLPRFGAVKTCHEVLLHYWRDSFEVCQALQSMTPETLRRLSANPVGLERLIEDARGSRSGIANQYRKRAARLAQSLARRRREIKAMVARWKRAA